MASVVLVGLYSDLGLREPTGDGSGVLRGLEGELESIPRGLREPSPLEWRPNTSWLPLFCKCRLPDTFLVRGERGDRIVFSALESLLLKKPREKLLLLFVSFKEGKA